MAQVRNVDQLRHLVGLLPVAVAPPGEWICHHCPSVVSAPPQAAPSVCDAAVRITWWGSDPDGHLRPPGPLNLPGPYAGPNTLLQIQNTLPGTAPLNWSENVPIGLSTSSEKVPTNPESTEAMGRGVDTRDDGQGKANGASPIPIDGDEGGVR